MWCRRVREESLTVEDVQLVDAVRKNLVFDLALYTCSGNNSLQINTELIGQLAAFGKQFLRDLSNGGLLYFAIYKNVVHISFDDGMMG